MAITEADVQTRLRALIDPNTGQGFRQRQGGARRSQIDAGDVVVDIQLGYPGEDASTRSLRKLITRATSASCPARRASPST